MVRTGLKFESWKVQNHIKNASQHHFYYFLKAIWILKSGCTAGKSLSCINVIYFFNHPSREAYTILVPDWIFRHCHSRGKDKVTPKSMLYTFLVPSVLSKENTVRKKSFWMSKPLCPKRIPLCLYWNHTIILTTGIKTHLQPYFHTSDLGLFNYKHLMVTVLCRSLETKHIVQTKPM